MSGLDVPFLTPLGPLELRSAHIPEPWTYGIADRVRFGEIDALQHVNNTAYLRWFENLRIHYFREYGLNDYRGTPPKIVLRNIGLDFKAEVKLNDEYIVTGRTVEFRTSSFTMNYGVWVRGALTTTGHAVIVMLDQDNTKRALPAALLERFRTSDGAVPA